MVLEGNTIQGCRDAGISLSGRSWCQLNGNVLLGTARHWLDVCVWCVVCVCVCVCVCARARARVCACVRACVRDSAVKVCLNGVCAGGARAE